MNLAFSYENLKDFKGAQEQYGRVLEIDPKSPKAYFGLARAYALEGQEQKALQVLHKAQLLAPEDKVDVQKIHDIIEKRKIGAISHRPYKKGKK